MAVDRRNRGRPRGGPDLDAARGILTAALLGVVIYGLAYALFWY